MTLTLRLPFLFLLVLLLALLSSSAPVPEAKPSPLSASLAQGLIAALTFMHAGVIGYAISHQSQTQAELIGDSTEQHLLFSHHHLFLFFSARNRELQ